MLSGLRLFEFSCKEPYPITARSKGVCLVFRRLLSGTGIRVTCSHCRSFPRFILFTHEADLPEITHDRLRKRNQRKSLAEQRQLD